MKIGYDFRAKSLGKKKKYFEFFCILIIFNYRRDNPIVDEFEFGIYSINAKHVQCLPPPNFIHDNKKILFAADSDFEEDEDMDYHVKTSSILSKI